MKIFITGIDGFLGAAIARHCQTEAEIVGNDNHICHTGLTDFAKSRVDCRHFEAMRDLLVAHHPDVLVHCAATAHEGLSTFSPSFVTQNIFEASIATFSAAIASGVKRIVFMSSMARYGRGQFGAPYSETERPVPVDPYGIAKVAAEEVLRILCDTHDVAWCVLVPHNIIGVGQKYDDPYRNVAAIFINQALQNLPLQIFGDGTQERCFSPVADILPCIKHAINGAANSKVVNIGPSGANATTINHLANTIKYLTRSSSPIVYVPHRPNEVKSAYCTSDRARDILKFQETQSLDWCLAEMVSFIRRHGPKPFQHFAKIEIDSSLLPKAWNNARETRTLRVQPTNA